MSSSTLLTQIKNLCEKEREINIHIIQHIQEVARRKLHLEMGYGSLFEFAVKELKYSEGAAYRRIEAMKLLNEIPEIETKIKTGDLSLSNATLIQSTAKEMKRESQNLRSESKKEMIILVLNKSTREAERVIEKYKKEKLGIQKRPGRIMKIEITEELEKKIELIKAHSHKLSGKSDQEFFEDLVEMLMSKLKGATPQLTSVPKDGIRAMKSPRARLLLQTAQYQCEYTDSKTKRRCSNQQYLQIDHKIPKSKNGGNEPQNLQVLCSNHNQWKSDRLM